VFQSISFLNVLPVPETQYALTFSSLRAICVAYLSFIDVITLII